MALEKRRESVGVNVDPKQRQNRITIAPINETIENEYSTEKESKPVVNENSAHSIADKVRCSAATILQGTKLFISVHFKNILLSEFFRISNTIFSRSR